MLDYNSLLTRVASIQVEALAALSPAVVADAKPYFFHEQESFPYFTNRIGGDEIGYDSQDFDRDTLQVIMRLVVGHITEGYVGQPETNLYTYIPAVKLYFNDRELLQSATYTTALTGLIEARIISHTGFRIFQSSGLSAQQVGTEFVLQCLMDETIVQAYT